MKWARFASALAKVFTGMFVKNTKSKQIAEGVEALADVQLDAVEQVISEQKRPAEEVK